MALIMALIVVGAPIVILAFLTTRVATDKKYKSNKLIKYLLITAAILFVITLINS